MNTMDKILFLIVIGSPTLLCVYCMYACFREKQPKEKLDDAFYGFAILTALGCLLVYSAITSEHMIQY